MEAQSCLCFEDKKPEPVVTEIFEDCLIDSNFIMRDDLRDWNFREDDNGMRYRERIFEQIQKFGVINWFKAKGYPTNPESLWKNRYTGSIEELQEGVKQGLIEQGWNGLTLWENWLPVELWNDKELMDEYKKGTSAYVKRIKEEEEDKKKWEKIERNKLRKAVKK